jgi:hypothetical protein
VAEWQTRQTQNPSGPSGNTAHRQVVTAKTASVHAASVRYNPRGTDQPGEWKRKANRHHHRNQFFCETEFLWKVEAD